MWVLLSILVLLGLGSALLALLTRHGDGDDAQPITVAPSCATCIGNDARCEQACMLEAATQEIVYFDDEELDRFAGRPSNGYTDEEVEAFREVMYTMQPREVKAWNRSLILRNVSLPDQMKAEAIMLMDDPE